VKFSLARKFAVIVVPLALAGGALAVSSSPAHAIDSCTPNAYLLQQANAAESAGDDWVAAEDVFIDDDNYEAVAYAYQQAGLAFADADRLYAAACA
jgi:hypothetical protein